MYYITIKKDISHLVLSSSTQALPVQKSLPESLSTLLPAVTFSRAYIYSGKRHFIVHFSKPNLTHIHIHTHTHKHTHTNTRTQKHTQKNPKKKQVIRPTIKRQNIASDEGKEKRINWRCNFREGRLPHSSCPG